MGEIKRKGYKIEGKRAKGRKRVYERKEER